MSFLKDVWSFFMDVVKCRKKGKLKLRKLVYFSLHRDLAILAVNKIVKVRCPNIVGFKK